MLFLNKITGMHNSQAYNKGKLSFSLLVIILSCTLICACSKLPRYPQEIRKAITVLEKDSSNVPAHKTVIELLFKHDYFIELTPYAKSLIEKTPDDIFAYVNLGNAYEKLHLLDKERETYKLLISNNSNDPTGYFRLARLAHKQGKYKECISCINTALSLGLSEPSQKLQSLQFLADALYCNNQKEEAYSALKELLEIDSTNKYALYTYGLWKLRENKYDEAIQILNKCIAQNPQTAYPYIRLGKAYYHQRKLKQAEKAFWDASRFDKSVRVLAEVVHVEDYQSTYNDINTAFVKVSNQYWYKDGNTCYARGIIENMGLEAAKSTSVIVRFYDKTNKLLEQKVCSISPKNLRPEQYAFFKTSIPFSNKIANVEIEPTWHKRSVKIYFK